VKLRRALVFASLLCAPLLLAFVAWLALAIARQGGLAPYRVPGGGTDTVAAAPAVLARGAYLARIGNCAGCHTGSDGEPYAGGRGFDTPYGTVFSSNLTPHPEAGIGDWSLQEFRHAMRHGVSRNGVQSPVFPYASFARLTDADLDALFAHLRTLPPSAAQPPDDALAFPANLPGAMTAWRLLYYRPVAATPALADAALEQGRYLVDGIGHCNLCHGSRGTLSSQFAEGYLAGGQVRGWHAPALNAATLERYPAAELAAYLRHGNSALTGAYGPMADVVFANLQHLHADDALAMARYLRAVPAPPPPRRRATRLVATDRSLALGEQLYADHCADCHGPDGEGEPGTYPALATSSAVLAPGPENAVNLILLGAVAPTTVGNPQPWTMPPFAHRMSAEQVAALVNYLRGRWGSDGRLVTADDVRALGSAYLD
jgi:mono/diheme cytochrome c family protein